MKIQGTSSKIHFIPFGVYLAMLIIYIKNQQNFGEGGSECYMKKKHLGLIVLVGQDEANKVCCFATFFLHHP